MSGITGVSGEVGAAEGRPGTTAPGAPATGTSVRGSSTARGPARPAPARPASARAASASRTRGLRTGVLAVAAVLALALPLAGCDDSPPKSGSRLPESRQSSPIGTASSPPGTATPTATTTGSPAGGTAIPARLEADGTTITVGDPSAPHTLTLYEDPRCPVCEQFEQANAGQITALEKAGVIRVQYTLASFLDQSLGGGGSKRAVNALRAAVDANGFAALHTLLYQYQPNERTDGFTVAYLLQLASQVPGLRGPAFDAAVRQQKYAGFVHDSEKAFLDSGANGTPTVKIDGHSVSDDQAIFQTPGFKKLLADRGIS